MDGPTFICGSTMSFETLHISLKMSNINDFRLKNGKNFVDQFFLFVNELIRTIELNRMFSSTFTHLESLPTMSTVMDEAESVWGRKAASS